MALGILTIVKFINSLLLLLKEPGCDSPALLILYLSHLNISGWRTF